MTSKLNLLSATDGSVVRELGFIEEVDKWGQGSSSRMKLYDHGNWINYYSVVCDTIYGIDKTTLDISPRIVLNIGNRLPPNVKGELTTNGFVTVWSICESDRYIFIDYNSLNNLYYDKKTGKTIPLISNFKDDITGSPLAFFPTNVTTNGRAYKVMRAVDIVSELGEERAAEMCIKEDDNPVIMVVKLKK